MADDLSMMTIDLSTVGNTYQVFIRNWYKCDGSPGPGRKTVMGYAAKEETARAWCQQYNSTHEPGPLSRKAEYTSSW